MNPPPCARILAPVRATGFTKPVLMLGHRFSYSTGIARITLKKEERKRRYIFYYLQTEPSFFGRVQEGI